jgi:hypothetical protein
MNASHLRPLRMLAVVWFLAFFVSCTGYKTSAVPPTPTLRSQSQDAISVFSFSPALGDRRNATVALHTRELIDQDLPGSMLRDYILHWAVTSPQGDTKFSEGQVALPTLAPGTDWSGQVAWDVPQTEYVLTVSIVQPAGFTVIERTYDEEGKLVE